MFSAAGAAKAQNALMSPPPTYSVTPPAMQAEVGQEMGSLSNGGHNAVLPEISDFLHWGPVTVHPHLSYQFLYGNGLLSQPGNTQNSIVQTFSPGVLFNIGTHWTLDYTPSLTYYSSSQFHNTVGQMASLNWGTYYNDWNFGFSQSYSFSDVPTVQTAEQTSTSTYSTAINASHQLNSLMSVDVSVTQAIVSADQFNSSKSWNTMGWLNYQFLPRLDGAIGVGGGYDSVTMGSDMTHETLQARLSWGVANKISLVVHGGGENTQFLGGGIPNLLSPIYGASILYQPFAQTSLSLGAERSVTPSFFSDQATESSSLSVGLNQRLLKHFNFNLTGSYGVTDYIASVANVASGRSDTYYSISSSLSWMFLKRASASITYQYSANNSSASGFGFNSSQYGFQLSYGF